MNWPGLAEDIGALAKAKAGTASEEELRRVIEIAFQRYLCDSQHWDLHDAGWFTRDGFSWCFHCGKPTTANILPKTE